MNSSSFYEDSDSLSSRRYFIVADNSKHKSKFAPSMDRINMNDESIQEIMHQNNNHQDEQDQISSAIESKQQKPKLRHRDQSNNDHIKAKRNKKQLRKGSIQQTVEQEQEMDKISKSKTLKIMINSNDNNRSIQHLQGSQQENILLKNTLNNGKITQNHNIQARSFTNRNSVLQVLQKNELNSISKNLPRRRIDSDVHEQIQQSNFLGPKTRHNFNTPNQISSNMNLNLQSLQSAANSPQSAAINQFQSFGYSPSMRGRRNTMLIGDPRTSGFTESNQIQNSLSSSKSQQIASQVTKKLEDDTDPNDPQFNCMNKIKSFFIRINRSNVFIVFMVIATAISTLLDLLRVAFFDSSVDESFFYIMLVMQMILLIHILGCLSKQGLKSYLWSITNLVEVAFFIDNFFSTYLVKSYNFYLVANYLKIMNVTRISNIVTYLKKRAKKKLVQKYMKEREKLRRRQEDQVQSFNKTEKRSLSLRPLSPTKKGEQIRDRFQSGNQDFHSFMHTSQRNSFQKEQNTQNRHSELSKISSQDHNAILQERFKEHPSATIDMLGRQDLKLENTYISLILSRTMTIFFFCVITVPFFLHTFYFPPHETLGQYYRTIQKTLVKQNWRQFNESKMHDVLERYVRIGVGIEETPLVYFQSKYYNYSDSSVNSLRENEIYIFDEPFGDGTKIFPMSMKFSRKTYNELQSLLGMCAYIWYFIFCFTMVWIIKRDIEVQVLNPFNALFEKIWSLVIDPMLVVNKQFQQIAGVYSMLQNKQKQSKEEEKDNAKQNQNGHQIQDNNNFSSTDKMLRLNSRKTFGNNLRRRTLLQQQQNNQKRQDLQSNIENEIEMIDESLFKISKLLMLYYGEAGAQIVSKMIRSESALLDFSEELGTKTMAIFGFCDIRNFTDATEVLQADVVSLVNQVAYIVHSNTVRYGGSPNKNIGDAFLLVWKLSSSKEMYEQLEPLTGKGSYRSIPPALIKEASIIADVALLSVLKTISQINTATELQQYNENPDMHRRLPGFKVKMGFGLHLGWAIEGMIGSNYKVDASYLSPNVNIASRLEAATKQYGVHLLLSEAFTQLLSPSYFNQTRIVDKSVLKGCQDPMELFTVDIDLNQGEIPMLNVAGIGIGVNQSCQSFPGNQSRSIRQVPQDVIRSEQRVIFESLYRGDLSTEQMLDKCAEAQEILIKSPYFRVFKLQYLQAFRLYIDGHWHEARLELQNCLRISPEDGPSQALLEYIESNQCDSRRVNWQGYRILEDK